MWIKKLYATFGKLENETMELTPGLNIVYGENESGKSTWTSFIRAMFYGVATRDQRKTGYLPDKEKFAPWNGSPMYGKMELSSDAGDITIERTAARGGVLSKVTSKYDETGLDAPYGEELVGVSQSVYERTAFIGQSGVKVTSDADCERRILSGASSGDEGVSAGEVASRLRKKQRSLRYNKSGILPQLEVEISGLSGRIEEVRAAESEISQIAESISSFKEAETRLHREKLIAKAEEEKKKTDFLAEATEAYDAARENAERLKDAPSRRDFDRFAEKKAAYTAAEALLKRSSETCALLKAESEEKKNICESSPFFGMSRAEAEALGKSMSEKAGEEEEKKSSVFPMIFFVAAAVFVVLGIGMPYMFIPALLCAVAGLVLLFEGRKRNRRENPFEKYGVADVFEFMRRLTEYIDATSGEEELSKKLSEAEVEVAKAFAQKELLCRDVESFAEDFKITYDDFEELEEKLRNFTVAREEAEKKFSDAKLRLETCKVTVGETSADIQYTEEEIPDRSSSEIEEELSLLSERQKRFEIELATRRAEISGFSVAEAEEKRKVLLENFRKAAAEYDALTLATDVINEAEVELKSRFSPEIERKTAEYFKELCGGNFSFVKIKNNEFEMDVSKGIATAPRDRLYLSSGTLDELYFALRLALFDTILPEEDAPPMVLDDVFVNFDDERMGKALSLLFEISKKRQVILFSCHKRETEFFEGENRVNKIKL